MGSRERIIIDNEVPFVEGVFEPFADVEYVPSDKITREVVKDADGMIIRSRTQCDASLLEGSSVKFIATDTIITSHIDLDYCSEHGIGVKNAAGCNAGGVMNYVFSALYGVASRQTINLDGDTIGIIGYGHVGSLVAEMARYLGFKVLICDPPLASVTDSRDFCSSDYLLKNSDIVTIHPMVDNETRKMANKDFFNKMKDGAMFINTSNGDLVDEEALKKAIPRLGPVIIDTWGHEPNVDKELVDMVDIATAHIAGYSYQGKQNGTAICVRALARFFEYDQLYGFFPKTEIQELESIKLDLRGKTQGEIAAVIQYNYPIFTDDFIFRLDPGKFVELRSNYKYRREFYVEY
ncbi:MAG: 4-phosphoerythronate dehydrogenase [Bacteroidales bacterium]|nr:4-phosphoerythronate dehydrogenase [Bacteroidales bacterium]MDY6002403.1 4-phosphoerythronate dehydrogenase [Candidatus Cryptobacteroides sp.]